jgi:acyl carrier protein
MTDLTAEVKELIVTTVDREDISIDSIGDETLLFDGGLDLDSIDALELAVVLQVKYKFKIDPKTVDLEKHFRTVSTLTKFIAENFPEADRYDT